VKNQRKKNSNYKKNEKSQQISENTSKIMTNHEKHEKSKKNN